MHRDAFDDPCHQFGCMSLTKSELSVLFRASLGSGFSTATRTESDATTHVEMPKPTQALILLLLLAVFPETQAVLSANVEQN